MTALTLEAVSSLSQIAAGAWDACIPGGPAAHPFLSHAFLEALESSGSATARTGWAGRHLLVKDGDDLLACAPLYQKSHSRGEYVFDWGWAEAFERAGGRYYPKLQLAVPFTPATGPRLLARCGGREEEARRVLAEGLDALLRQTAASSLHATFLSAPDADALEARGWLMRHDQQFHWVNEGYGKYEDFLSALAARKRKALRRERREAAEGLTIRRLTGAELTEAVWDDMFAFYMDTGSRKWGRPYLTRRFFSLIGERMADRLMVVVAERNGRRIAGALNVIGEATLYGRYWGALEHHPFLHFELCYHQAIDFAIEQRLAVVEAGAQGEHKLARGYRPVLTRSAHRIADPGLSRAVARFLIDERADIRAMRDMLAGMTPFRRGPADTIPEGEG